MFVDAFPSTPEQTETNGFIDFALTEARNIYKGNLILGYQHFGAIGVSSLEDMTALGRGRFMDSNASGTTANSPKAVNVYLNDNVVYDCSKSSVLCRPSPL